MTDKNKNCNQCDDCQGGGVAVMPPQNNCGGQSPCVDPNTCSSITKSNCVFYVGGDILCNEDVIATEGDTQSEINAAIVQYFCERLTPLGVMQLTYSEAVTLASDGSIELGRKYFITDRGILLDGVDQSNFSVTGERLMRVVKNAYYGETSPSAGVWNPNYSISADTVVIWGGKVWLNLTGSIGTSDNDYTLDSTNWQLIPTTNTTYYETRSFTIHYDFSNDWVAKQFDWKGNEFGISYNFYQEDGLGYNPVDISDWGSEIIFNNKAYGVFNNIWLVYDNIIPGYINENFVVISNTNLGNISKNYVAVTSNMNLGRIELNTCSNIYNNQNGGYIVENSNNGSIFFNSNLGNIFLNSNDGNVNNNFNIGIIGGNSNEGHIASNSNNGYILNIGSATSDIINNINNGVISTTVSGTISDSIVDK